MLYLIASAVVIAIQAAIVMNWHAPPALPAASILTEPFFTAIVTAFAYADLRGDFEGPQVWLRVLERSWAVVIIALLFNLVAGLGLESLLAPDLLDRVLGTGVIIVAVSFVFADVHAIVADDAEPWWWLLPRSFGASMAAAWQGASFARALIVFALGDILPWLLSAAMQNALEDRHVAFAALWANAVALKYFE